VKYCPLYTCTSVFFDPCVLIHSSAIFGHVRLSKPKATLTASCVVFYSGGKHGHCESHAWSNDFVRFCMWVGQRGQSSRSSPGTPAILGRRRRTRHTWSCGPGLPVEAESCKRQAEVGVSRSLAAFQVPGGHSVQLADRAERRKIH
jgi:hypothetical protein